MSMDQVSRADAISKPAFHARLRAWLSGTDESIVGSPDVPGLSAWVYVHDGGNLYKLHADAKRAAVSEYLSLVDQLGDGLAWTIVPNERGNMNAVAYGPAKTRIVPFYFYLVESGVVVDQPARRYWVTTHWPPEASYTGRELRNVYLQDGHEGVGLPMSPGDGVLIYESASGPAVVEQLPNGTKNIIVRRPGKQGIVTAANVQRPFSRRLPVDAVEHYADGSMKNWAWEAITESHISNGFVPQADLLRILGYALNYNLRGFGESHSGLRQVSKEQYDELLAVFVSNSVVTANAPGGQQPRPGHWTEGGGEGPEHLALKEYVAANPSVVLGEPGVVTLKIEYPFPSGDRADIALRDQAGRFIGVEIELEQSDTQLEGLLQAIKYRHMLAVMEGVTFEECRSVLVAYKLGNKIKQLCKQYDVKAIEALGESVRLWQLKRVPPSD